MVLYLLEVYIYLVRVNSGNGAPSSYASYITRYNILEYVTRLMVVSVGALFNLTFTSSP